MVSVLRRGLPPPEHSRQNKRRKESGTSPAHPQSKQERQTERKRSRSAFLVSLTDVIKDMFPSLSVEDKHRIAVTDDAISDHQTSSEENEGHQHEYQNPHHR